MLSCLAVGNGGQRGVLTEPIWVLIGFSQRPEEQNVSFNFLPCSPKLREFHQAFTSFRKFIRSSPSFHQVPENPWGLRKLPRISLKFGNFTRSLPIFQISSGFTRPWMFHQVFTRFRNFHQILEISPNFRPNLCFQFYRQTDQHFTKTTCESASFGEISKCKRFFNK